MSTRVADDFTAIRNAMFKNGGVAKQLAYCHRARGIAATHEGVSCWCVRPGGGVDDCPAGWEEARAAGLK